MAGEAPKLAPNGFCLAFSGSGVPPKPNPPPPEPNSPPDLVSTNIYHPVLVAICQKLELIYVNHISVDHGRSSKTGSGKLETSWAPHQ